VRWHNCLALEVMNWGFVDSQVKRVNQHHCLVKTVRQLIGFAECLIIEWLKIRYPNTLN